MLNITCYDSMGNTITHLTQWDINQKIIIKDFNLKLDSPPFFHFETTETEESLVVLSEFDSKGFIVTKIPNILLQQSSEQIKIYIYIYDGEGSKVSHEITLPVRTRKKPSDYTYIENITQITNDKIIHDINQEISKYKQYVNDNLNDLFNEQIPKYKDELSKDIDKLSKNTDEMLNKKVDKIDGKFLSTNDYSDADKSKLSNAVQNTFKINDIPLSHGDINLEAKDIQAYRPLVNGFDAPITSQNYLIALDNEKLSSTRKINSKPLASDITLNAGDVGAVPTSRKVNGKALTTDITLSAADISAVPVTRKINSKVLNSDITLTAADVGAIPTTAKGTADGVVALPASLPPVGSVLSMGANGTATTAKFDDFSASVQSGSNANGHYIKYPNGTMICYGNPSYTLPANAWGNSIVWSYPTSFAAIPVVTTTIAADTQAATFNLNVGYTNNSQVFFHIKNNGTTERNINVNCMAIGRWK